MTFCHDQAEFKAAFENHPLQLATSVRALTSSKGSREASRAIPGYRQSLSRSWRTGTCDNSHVAERTVAGHEFVLQQPYRRARDHAAQHRARLTQGFLQEAGCRAASA